jgi:hypothetical protein
VSAACWSFILADIRFLVLSFLLSFCKVVYWLLLDRYLFIKRISLFPSDFSCFYLPSCCRCKPRPSGNAIQGTRHRTKSPMHRRANTWLSLGRYSVAFSNTKRLTRSPLRRGNLWGTTDADSQQQASGGPLQFLLTQVVRQRPNRPTLLSSARAPETSTSCTEEKASRVAFNVQRISESSLNKLSIIADT